MLRDAGREGLRREYCLQAGNGTCVPVQLSFFQLRADDANGIAVITTDITERIQAEEKIRSLASELAIAEQEERHRISQVLHDDLQQRLFAIRAQLSFLMEFIGQADKVTELQMSVDQIQSWLSEAIKITRDLSVDISPSVLHGEGIAEAIYWLASRMKEQHNLELEVEAKDDFPHMPDHVARDVVPDGAGIALQCCKTFGHPACCSDTRRGGGEVPPDGQQIQAGALMYMRR